MGNAEVATGTIVSCDKPQFQIISNQRTIHLFCNLVSD